MSDANLTSQPTSEQQTDIAAKWPTKSIKLLEALENANFLTAYNLLCHLPQDYLDLSQTTAVSKWEVNQEYLVDCVITKQKILYAHRPITELSAVDTFGTTFVIKFYFGSKFLSHKYAVGSNHRLLLKPRLNFRTRKNPVFECYHPQSISPAMLAQSSFEPRYRTIRKVKQEEIKKLITNILLKYELDELLPHEILTKHQLPNIQDAMHQLHQPRLGQDSQQLISEEHPARIRLRLEELVAMRLAFAKPKLAADKDPLKLEPEKLDEFWQACPLVPTNSQVKVIEQIHDKLVQKTPMRLLLYGDVGSGKTLAAVAGALPVLSNGKTVLLMAPTEILAYQHHQTISPWLEKMQIGCDLLIGSQTAREQKALKQKIAEGQTRLLIGTHALLSEKINLPFLDLVIIDEQHRFGVKQRLTLLQKTAHAHQLMMSATPIPRTLAMSMYAGMDILELQEKPSGRLQVQTVLVNGNRDQEKRISVLDKVLNQVRADRQAYWICPLIESSENLDLEDADKLFAQALERGKGLSIALLHGRVEGKKRLEILKDFQAQKIKLLIATTIIEVGVDAPNADVIVVEHAERMGLAQLHQLRGRVGRGVRQGYCVLLHHPPLTADAEKRLRALQQYDDGFTIAKIDLNIRGAGELIGQKQSGAVFRFAHEHDNEKLSELAIECINKMNDQQKQELLNRWYAKAQELIRT